MGCDIHIYVEKKVEDKWEYIEGKFGSEKYPADAPFDWRCYDIFSFLAGVRNRSSITPLAEPIGLPDDMSEYVREIFHRWRYDIHNCSWFLASELLTANYDLEVIDVREDNKKMTLRDFLGEAYGFKLEYDDRTLWDKIKRFFGLES
jgi:hypothetical protein